MEKEFIHFSDGTKAVCGANSGSAVTDEQKVTCSECQDIITKKAQEKGDPRITVRVKNMDLNDGVDFAFFFKAPKQEGETDKQVKNRSGKNYRLVNNAVHRLPRSVVEHLKKLAYPYKRYVPGQEAGQAMQVAGKYRRFVVQEVSEEELKETKYAKTA